MLKCNTTLTRLDISGKKKKDAPIEREREKVVVSYLTHLFFYRQQNRMFRSDLYYGRAQY